ncbi:lipase family protein [Sorangium sp. So ce1000]|uniref:lipase family protein n=1 Tax=Sorangium sp. So ce1000 TaxID=3133325 RepID=UPI003F5E6ACD
MRGLSEPQASESPRGGVAQRAALGGQEAPSARGIVEHLIESQPGEYDSRAARLLATASAWAYADIDTFARIMGRRGFKDATCVEVALTNEELFIDTSAFLVQSQCKRLAILCFRGTKLRNVITWLTDAAVKPEPFYSAGSVHGGFYRAARAVWSPLLVMLSGALHDRRIDEELSRELSKTSVRSVTLDGLVRGVDEDRFDEVLGEVRAIKKLVEEEARAQLLERTARLNAGAGLPDVAAFAPARDEGASLVRSAGAALDEAGRHAAAPEAGSRSGEEPKLQALYITGHSLGGALAVLAASQLFMTNEAPEGAPIEDLKALQTCLRGVYTFGQPMVGDKEFAKELGRRFGKKRLFRHVYGVDVVPSLPPISTGRFAHFGHELRANGSGWGEHKGRINQTWSATLGLALGVAAFVIEQLPFLHWIKLNFSLADHSPLNYLRVSQQRDSVTEFD